MYREGRFDAEELAAAALSLNELRSEIDATRSELGLDPDPGLGREPTPSSETAEFIAQRTEQTSDFPAVEPDPTPTPAFSSSGAGPSVPEPTPPPDHRPPERAAEPTGQYDLPEGDSQPVLAPDAVAPDPTGGMPSPPSAVDALLGELEQAERDAARRSKPAESVTAGPAGEDTDTFAALEAAFAQERDTAVETVAALEERLRQAERRTKDAEAKAATAEKEATRAQAESRTAAAEWLRRESEAIRAEVAGQVGGGPERAELESKLKQAEAETARLRNEKAEAIQAAEKRLAEIERQAEQANRRLDEAEQRLAAESADDPVAAEAKAEAEAATARAVAAEARVGEAEARADAAEAEARQAAAAWLRSQSVKPAASEPAQIDQDGEGR